MSENQQRTIGEIIEGFPDAGWWQKETYNAIYEAAYRMEKAGWPYEMIEKLLKDIYIALRKEYGID